MPQINYVTITNDFIKDGFFSEYLPPVFSIHNSFDPCSISLSSTADLVAPLSFNMSRFTEDGKRRTIYMPVFEAILSIAFHSPSVTQKDFFLFRLRLHRVRPCLVKSLSPLFLDLMFYFFVSFGRLRSNLFSFSQRKGKWVRASARKK